MRILRFIGEDGRIYKGCGYKDDKASIIQGDIFGDFEVTKRKIRVKEILPPFDPAAIFCIGLNYKMHAAETGMELPRYPVVFMKNPASVSGAFADIEIPRSCLDPLQVDYEVELGVVIGRSGKDIQKKDALDHVLGYTCANDISARRWQKKAGGGQWVRGKSFDTFCPMGPEIVTPDEIHDPMKLKVESRLNNEVMQKGETSDMIFSVAELIAFLSENTTILSGTLIMTGTPSGVGFARNPPVYLKPGDCLETIVEGVGHMINNISASN